VSLLFEDAFRNYVDDLKRAIKRELPKAKKKGDIFDPLKLVT